MLDTAKLKELSDKLAKQVIPGDMYYEKAVAVLFGIGLQKSTNVAEMTDYLRHGTASGFEDGNEFVEKYNLLPEGTKAFITETALFALDDNAANLQKTVDNYLASVA